MPDCDYIKVKEILQLRCSLTYLTDESGSDEFPMPICIVRGVMHEHFCFDLPSSLDADLPPVGIHRLDKVERDLMERGVHPASA